LEIFKDYSRFVTGFTGQSPPAYANTWSGFIGMKTVGILCLNSAWMCGRNKDAKGVVNDYGFLVVGEPQLHEALAKIRAADLRIAVCITRSPGWPVSNAAGSRRRSNASATSSCTATSICPGSTWPAGCPASAR
jgi:hypothetical protein